MCYFNVFEIILIAFVLVARISLFTQSYFGNSGRETLYKLILLSVLYRDDIDISARFYLR